jgi:hypothetical protein
MRSRYCLCVCDCPYIPLIFVFVFYAVRVVSNESRRLVLIRTPCVRIIKSRRLNWAQNVARMQDRMKACRNSVVKPTERFCWKIKKEAE